MADPGEGSGGSGLLIRPDGFLTGWFFNEMRIAFCTLKLNSRDIQKCKMFLGTLLWSVRLCSSQSLLVSTRGGCSKGASFSSRIQVHNKWPRNTITYNRDWWEGMWEVWGRSNLTQKSSTVFSEPKFGPPNQIDPPLLLAPRVFTRTYDPKYYSHIVF